MGRVKAMMMDLEEKFEDKAVMLAEIWTEHQESAGKEAYGGVVLDD